jgi:uncharacterized integral membrane protein (TIGR00698 family)
MDVKTFLSVNGPGLLISLLIAGCSWALVLNIDVLTVIGAPIIAIVAGMIIFILAGRMGMTLPKTSFASKYVLQFSVVLLGFGLNLRTVMDVGLTSLPVIVSTISISLIMAYLMYRLLRSDAKTSTLVGVGSSICGGSAIAATAPVIRAEDHVIAQSISVIFLFNVIAALVFPTLGTMLGMTDEGFALFAGTAINDTSSVTAAAATWDSMHGTGHAVLDSATIVKLTRTLFIIPIVVVLSFVVAKRESEGSSVGSYVKRAFPKFIAFFVLASLVTTVTTSTLSGDALTVANDCFSSLKMVSSFLISTAMAAIGLNTDIVKLVRTGGRTLLIGGACWIAIICTSLLVQSLLGIW